MDVRGRAGRSLHGEKVASGGRRCPGYCFSGENYEFDRHLTDALHMSEILTPP